MLQHDHFSHIHTRSCVLRTFLFTCKVAAFGSSLVGYSSSMGTDLTPGKNSMEFYLNNSKLRAIENSLSGENRQEIKIILKKIDVSKK